MRNVSGLYKGLALIIASLMPSLIHALPPGAKDVTAVLFEWSFESIAKECTNTIGPAGYGYVQVSPPAEHIQGSQWWTSYQPVSYKIAGRLGNQESFQNMVTTCHAAGVKIIVDAVINHMSSGSGTGTGGSSYSKYNYPGLYSPSDFDDCTSGISNYADRINVQHCELVGLADLDTPEEYPRRAISTYLNDLLSLDVDGFRIDAAKHIASEDLANIKSRLANSSVYWKQEVIYGSGEAVQPEEYTGNGDVQEFRYAYDLKRIFNSGRLAELKSYGESRGYLRSSVASVFINNHDTERNGATLSYKDNAKYTLANVFMLAHPYGAPDVHSGYEFSDQESGPPNNGAINACYQNGWKCQHAWPEIKRMVAFHNVAHGYGLTNWWDNGNNVIGFGRGNVAYVAINSESGSVTQTYQTSLTAGTYCNVQSNTYITVDSSGQFTTTLDSNTALAIYKGKTSC